MTIRIYPIEVFRAAIAASNRRYIIDRVRYTDCSGEVRKVEDKVIIRKRVTHTGRVQYVDSAKPLRWDGSRRCFTISSTGRHSKYDLPLATFPCAVSSVLV